MRVSTATHHAQDSGQVVPEWMKERRGPRPLISREFQVSEAGRLAYTSLRVATCAPCGSFVPGPRFVFPQGAFLDLICFAVTVTFITAFPIKSSQDLLPK